MLKISSSMFGEPQGPDKLLWKHKTSSAVSPHLCLCRRFSLGTENPALMLQMTFVMNTEYVEWMVLDMEFKNN